MQYTSTQLCLCHKFIKYQWIYVILYSLSLTSFYDLWSKKSFLLNKNSEVNDIQNIINSFFFQFNLNFLEYFYAPWFFGVLHKGGGGINLKWSFAMAFQAIYQSTFKLLVKLKFEARIISFYIFIKFGHLKMPIHLFSTCTEN